MENKKTLGHLPGPVVNPENKPFWDAANEQKFLLKFCQGCQRPHYYPRAICPHCGSDRTEWQASKGEGEVYSYTVMRRGVEHPFAMAYIALDEGIKVLTHIVGCDFDSIRIGQRMKVVFEQSSDGAHVPVFTPIS